MKAISLVSLFAALALAGCGGTSTASSVMPLTGSYVGTWATSPGGASNGQASVSVTSANLVTFTVFNSSNSNLDQTGSGTADAQGNFSGTMSNSLQSTPFQGVISGNTSQVKLTITYQLTPGTQPAPSASYYITATPATQ